MAALAALPLVWRRRYPIAVTSFVGVGTLGLALTGAFNDVSLPYGQLVASTISTPGMTGAPGKCPWKNGSLYVTLLMPTALRPSSNATIRSTRRNG